MRALSEYEYRYAFNAMQVFGYISGDAWAVPHISPVVSAVHNDRNNTSPGADAEGPLVRQDETGERP